MSQIAYQRGEYPDLIGRRSAFAGNLPGPASYVTGGDPVQFAQFNYYIDTIHGTLSVSGNYLLRFLPSGPLPRPTWKAKWIVVSSGLEAGPGTNLSAETAIVSGYGGLF